MAKLNIANLFIALNNSSIVKINNVTNIKFLGKVSEKILLSFFSSIIFFSSFCLVAIFTFLAFLFLTLVILFFLLLTFLLVFPFVTFLFLVFLTVVFSLLFFVLLLFVLFFLIFF